MEMGSPCGLHKSGPEQTKEEVMGRPKPPTRSHSQRLASHPLLGKSIWLQLRWTPGNWPCVKQVIWRGSGRAGFHGGCTLRWRKAARGLTPKASSRKLLQFNTLLEGSCWENSGRASQKQPLHPLLRAPKIHDSWMQHCPGSLPKSEAMNSWSNNA